MTRPRKIRSQAGFEHLISHSRGGCLNHEANKAEPDGQSGMISGWQWQKVFHLRQRSHWRTRRRRKLKLKSRKVGIALTCLRTHFLIVSFFCSFECALMNIMMCACLSVWFVWLACVAKATILGIAYNLFLLFFFHTCLGYAHHWLLLFYAAFSDFDLGYGSQGWWKAKCDWFDFFL